MSNKINIQIQEVEASLHQMRIRAENAATKIPNDEMSPNSLTFTSEMVKVNKNIQKVLDQYKALLFNHLNSTKKSAYEMVKTDEKIAQDISNCIR